MNKEQESLLTDLLGNINRGNLPTDSEIEKIKDNKEIMIEILQRLPHHLQYCSENLKSDRQLVCTAIKISGSALQYANETLQKETDIMLIALDTSGEALRYANEDLKNDKKIILTAVEKYGAFSYIGESLKNDREIVLKAIKYNQGIIVELNEYFKDDEEIVKIAINQNPWAFEHASERLKNDKNFILELFLDIENNIGCGQMKKDVRKRLLLGNLSSNIKDQIASNDPLQYLKSAILKEKLEQTIPEKIQNNKKKIKV